MPSVVPVLVHESQFPDEIRRDLLKSLRMRRVNHKFHYDTVKQAQQWLALHQAYSLSRHDPDCARIYDDAFKAAVSMIAHSGDVHLIGIGSGGGQKDARLLKYLRKRSRTAFYTPCDVSAAMVLTAWKAACSNRAAKQPVISASDCFPIICDIAKSNDLPRVFRDLSEKQYSSQPTTRVRSAGYARRDTQHPTGPIRLFTFFGMIPNFEPDVILPRLASLIRNRDLLLFSANLAPGADYDEGVEKVMPQYDNSLTREWLMTFLLDLGVAKKDGRLRFSISSDNSSFHIKRIEARFHFQRVTRIALDAREFVFRAGESIRLFFSCRYTPALVQSALRRHGLMVRQQWVATSEEEGVFLVQRNTN